MDPGNYRFRSCALTFNQLGDYARAMQFLQLDARDRVVLRQHEARIYSRWTISESQGNCAQLSRRALARLTIACMDNPASETAVNGARQAAAQIMADPDPEVSYTVAPDILFCGQKELAMNMLRAPSPITSAPTQACRTIPHGRS